MTQAQATLIGALLIVLTIFFCNGISPAKALGEGPFQLMHHSNTAANAGVFRLDVSTGEVTYCFVTGANGTDLVCTRAVR